MQDFSQLLREKNSTIVEQWVASVSRDRQITSTEHLDRSAIQDHIDYVLEALATVLSQQQADDTEAIVNASISHGVLRANQGFDPSEIAQEYHLLRKTIFDILRPDLLSSDSEDLLRAISLINAVVDSALSQCFKSYVQERLQELELVQHQLTMTVEELKRLAQANQDNLSVLAHELKTPLTSIIGYSDLFLRLSRQDGNLTSSKKLEHIERVLGSGRRLLHIINDALELARYEAGKLQPVPELTDVRAVIQTVVEVMQPLADSRKLDLVVTDTQAPSQVITDPTRLQQILTNLVSNAVRYTEAGSVTIKCEGLPNDRWLCSVSDTGIGIALADQSRLFKPFVRAEFSNHPHPSDSTGLGLAIVARLVELLQGRIHLTSQVKEGSTFTVVLPLKMTLD
ncbi:MAG: sensor histidine kinase [Myxacorys chilensis ATA2-1-KO14]|jgi:hypothetical protein|nr:sensor histidine kinase [Myxacorys chilensis ATA2-1-KO14]